MDFVDAMSWGFSDSADFKNHALDTLPLDVLCCMNSMVHWWMKWTYYIYVFLLFINIFYLVCAACCWLCADFFLFLFFCFQVFNSTWWRCLDLYILYFNFLVFHYWYLCFIVSKGCCSSVYSASYWVGSFKSINIYLWLLQERETSFLKLQKLPSGFHPGANNDTLNSVNKLCDYWYKRQSIVVIDDQVMLSVAR